MIANVKIDDVNVTCGDKTLVIYIGMDLEIENALKYLVYFGYFDDKEELFNTGT